MMSPFMPDIRFTLEMKPSVSDCPKAKTSSEGVTAKRVSLVCTFIENSLSPDDEYLVKKETPGLAQLPIQYETTNKLPVLSQA